MIWGLGLQERTSLLLKTIYFCFKKINSSYPDTIIMATTTENSSKDKATKQAQSSRKSAAHKNTQRFPTCKDLSPAPQFWKTTHPDFPILSQTTSCSSISLALPPKTQLRPHTALSCIPCQALLGLDASFRLMKSTLAVEVSLGFHSFNSLQTPLLQ